MASQLRPIDSDVVFVAFGVGSIGNKDTTPNNGQKLCQSGCAIATKIQLSVDRTTKKKKWNNRNGS